MRALDPGKPFTKIFVNGYNSKYPTWTGGGRGEKKRFFSIEQLPIIFYIEVRMGFGMNEEKFSMEQSFDLRRRSVTKAILWRIIGIIWTWMGAYLILLFMPERYKSALLMATAIVIYHHSTRMIMYYLYERIWSGIGWGKTGGQQDEKVILTAGQRLAWTIGIVICLVVIFFIIFYITPLLSD